MIMGVRKVKLVSGNCLRGRLILWVMAYVFTLTYYQIIIIPVVRTIKLLGCHALVKVLKVVVTKIRLSEFIISEYKGWYIEEISTSGNRILVLNSRFFEIFKLKYLDSFNTCKCIHISTKYSSCSNLNLFYFTCEHAIIRTLKFLNKLFKIRKWLLFLVRHF